MLTKAVFYLSTVTVAFSAFGVKAEDFISEGKARGVIVISAHPSGVQQFAAEELRVFLKKMTGLSVGIEKTDKVPAVQPVIIVGDHPANVDLIKKLKARYPIIPGSWKTAGNYDAFAVTCDGKQLKLVGNSSSALLYGAWGWLESLGIRWIMPGERGTYVPSLKEVPLTPVDKLETPGLAFRGPNYVMPESWGYPASSNVPEHGVPAAAIFSYRQRLNNNSAFEVKDNWPTIGSGHSYHYYVTPERYFKDHPEWFNMINGQRQRDQLCFTNRESAREFARNISVDIANTLKLGVPIERMRISVSPNDGNAWCECPNCRKLVDSDGRATSMVTHYTNLVAEEIRKTYPHARILFYAYSNYTRPGDLVKPGPGVGIELAFWTDCHSVTANPAQPLFSEGNDKFRRYFKQWSALCDHISVYVYYGHYLWFTPYPQLTQMAHDIPIMVKDPKFYGMYSETHLHWGTQAPNFYLYPKLMWNPHLDVNAVMDDFYAKGFGPAGPDIKRYYQELQKKMDSLPYISGMLTEIPQFLTPEVVAQGNDCIDRAQKLLDQMDPGTRWRTNLVIQAWRNSAKCALAMRLFINPNPQPGDREKIIKLLSEVMTFAGTEQGRWAFAYRIVNPAVNLILTPLSAPLNQLPTGTHSYNFDLGYGGAIKFLGRADGFEKGIWGYGLATHGRGSIDLPLHAVSGHKLASALVTWAIACQEGIGIKVSASAASHDQRRLLAEGISQCRKPITVPTDMLGDKIDLHIQVDNRSPDAQIVLTSMNLNITVEPKK